MPILGGISRIYFWTVTISRSNFVAGLLCYLPDCQHKVWCPSQSIQQGTCCFYYCEINKISWAVLTPWTFSQNCWGIVPHGMGFCNAATIMKNLEGKNIDDGMDIKSFLPIHLSLFSWFKGEMLLRSTSKTCSEGWMVPGEESAIPGSAVSQFIN